MTEDISNRMGRLEINASTAMNFSLIVDSMARYDDPKQRGALKSGYISKNLDLV